MVPDDEQGAQLVNPMDARIMAAITASGAADSVPVATEGWQVLGDEIEDAYATAASSLLSRMEALTQLPGDTADLRVVLTAMHGVGRHWRRSADPRRGRRTAASR